MPEPDDEAIAAIRRFNRFHTKLVGALGPSLHGSAFSLSEARVLYELAQQDGLLAGELARELGLDPAYLSRILKRFVAAGWLERSPSPEDGRARRLRLTSSGRQALAPLDEASRRQVVGLLDRLAPCERDSLIAALAQAQRLLSGEPLPGPVIREHRPGDLGWVIGAHARLYAQDYGWSAEFESFVAEIAIGFLRDFQPGRERGFIAELDGEPVGSAFVMRDSNEVAKLRMVLVEPRARGLGLGRRLVREAIAFARQAGYARMVLWTNDILHAARAIYVAEGFELVAEERHHSFGQDLVGQNWRLELAPVTP